MPTKKFRYSWYPPLFLKGTVQIVTFSKDQRKYTDIQPLEPCLIEEVQTMYDANGTCEHFYLVRFAHKRSFTPSVMKSRKNEPMPQLNLVKESALDTVNNRLLISRP